MDKRTTTCGFCEGEFTPSRAGHNYCSKNCRNKAWVRDNPRTTNSRPVTTNRVTSGREVECGDCAKTFLTNSKSKITQCNQCRHDAMKRRAAAKGPCTVEGCGAPQFCKGMCSKHYWEHRGNVAPRASRLYERQCEWCDKVTQSTDRYAKHCSTECAMKTREGWSKSTGVVRVDRYAHMRGWAGHTLPARPGAPLVAGPCTHCGDNFVARPGAVYCSTRCSSNASWRRKYEARGDFYISPRARQEIYARDGWICQLCGDPVDKDAPVNTLWSATLDHIIPQSLQLIPDHRPEALRLAHMWCNAKRGNRVEVELTA